MIALPDPACNTTFRPPLVTPKNTSFLEHSSVAAWLLEPDIPVEERTRRAFNVRVRDLRRQKQFLRSAPPASSSAFDTPHALQHLKGCLDEIAQQAGTLGFGAHNDGSGWLTFVGGAGVPGTATPTRTIFGQPDVWHLLPGAEHGRSWALLGLGMRTVEQSLVHTSGVESCGVRRLAAFATRYIARRGGGCTRSAFRPPLLGRRPHLRRNDRAARLDARTRSTAGQTDPIPVVACGDTPHHGTSRKRQDLEAIGRAAHGMRSGCSGGSHAKRAHP